MLGSDQRTFERGGFGASKLERLPRAWRERGQDGRGVRGRRGNQALVFPAGPLRSAWAVVGCCVLRHNDGPALSEGGLTTGLHHLLRLQRYLRPKSVEFSGLHLFNEVIKNLALLC
jgi:hypothetical protein